MTRKLIWAEPPESNADPATAERVGELAARAGYFFGKVQAHAHLGGPEVERHGDYMLWHAATKFGLVETLGEIEAFLEREAAPRT